MAPRNRDAPERVNLANDRFRARTSANAVDDSLLRPERVWARHEILARPSPVPAQPGVYAWYFRTVLGGAPIDHVFNGMALLYVGISPGDRPGSRQHLRSRIRYHFSGNAEGSTLRLSLGLLLGLQLRRVGRGRRMTFTGPGEIQLSSWMAENAFVCWHVVDEPWHSEERLIGRLSLPLNLAANQRHAFYPTLTAMRRDAREQARALPVWVPDGKPR